MFSPPPSLTAMDTPFTLISPRPPSNKSTVTCRKWTIPVIVAFVIALVTLNVLTVTFKLPPLHILQQQLLHVQTLKYNSPASFASSVAEVYYDSDLTDSDRQIVLFIPIAQTDISRHIASLSLSWFSNTLQVAHLCYIVGNRRTGEPDVEQQQLAATAHISIDELRQQLAPELRAAIRIIEVDAVDNEYPPVTKELVGLQSLWTKYAAYKSVQYVMKFDADSYVEPHRLQQYVQSMSATTDEPQYLGRPLHHCQCSPNATIATDKTHCTADVGINYCAGSSYMINRVAMQKYAGNIDNCLQPPLTEVMNATQCRSSDTRLGYCMNLLNIKCSAAAHVGVPLPDHGKSWGEPDAARKGVKRTFHSHFCQDRSTQTGLADRRPGRPYTYNTTDLQNCIVFHPLKATTDMKYLQYSIERQIPQSTALTAVKPDECTLAIGVLSTANANGAISRDVIRSTWGRIAQAVGGAVQVHFLLGNNANISPDVEIALKREMSTHGDVLLFENVDDGYFHIYEKTLSWLQYASQSTSCRYVFKTDDDTYLRIMPFLWWLQTLPTTTANPTTQTAEDQLYYFGYEHGRNGTSKVIQDPTNAWYMHDQYPHKVYPPYMSGIGYGMSRQLAAKVVQQSSNFPVFRLEDAAVGIVIDSINKDISPPVVYTSPATVFNVMQCHADSVIDNPAFSYNYNFYERYYADLNNRFCGFSRRTYTSASTHSMKLRQNVYNYMTEAEYLNKLQQTAVPLNQSILVTMGNADWFHIDLTNRKRAYLHGGMDVRKDLTPADTTFVQTVEAQMNSFVSSMNYCKSTRLVDMWKLQQMSTNTELVAVVECYMNRVVDMYKRPIHSKPPQQSADKKVEDVKMQYHLVRYVDGHLQSQMVRSDRTLTVVIPYACQADKLHALIRHLETVYDDLPPMVKHKIVVSWMQCHDPLQEPSVGDVESTKSMTSVEVVIAKSDVKFSRGEAIDAALGYCADDEIAVVLDLDMRLEVDYLVHSLAFVQQRISMYFPVVYSHYNPAMVANDPRIKQLTTKSNKETMAVDANRGLWRTYGYGMVAAVVSDFQTIGGYVKNVNNMKKNDTALQKQWGLEDVHLYGAAADTFKRVRMIEPACQHVYHPKNCTAMGLTGTDRELMCLGSKLNQEGTAWQIAYKAWQHGVFD